MIWRWSVGSFVVLGLDGIAANQDLHGLGAPIHAPSSHEADLGLVLLQVHARTHPAIAVAQRAGKESCLEEFQRCWNQDRGHWEGDPSCRQSLVSCRRHLCKNVLPFRCRSHLTSLFVVDCKTLTSMCHHTQAKDFNGKAMEVDHPLIFLHLPKNAGTNIEEAGKDAHVRWGRHWTWGTVQMPDGTWCNKYHVPPVFLPDLERYLNGEVFCIVRHPFDRAVSEYKYLLQMPWGGSRVDLPPDADWCHPVGLNSYLTRLMRAINAGYPFINDCHMVRQTDYVWHLGKQWCQDVIPIENLSDDFHKIMKRVGYNVTLRKEENRARLCENITREDLNASTKALLRAYYKEDFINFNYSWD